MADRGAAFLFRFAAVAACVGWLGVAGVATQGAAPASQAAPPAVAPMPTAPAPGWRAPRTPDGHPDLQGYWTSLSFTPLERPEKFGTREFLTDEELAQIFRAGVDRSLRIHLRELG